jgi:predicted CXXCH cytochrome family protein
MLHRHALTRAWRIAAPAVLALLVAACAGDDASTSQPAGVSGGLTFSPLPGTDDHVGGAVCGQCHAAERADWQGSHHDLAMQPATPETVLGDFDGASFEHQGITSVFTRRDARHFVNTDGPDGTMAEFEIRYAFGHYPLQQYLIELPGGRLQAFGIAWDSRAAADGGQRWFHLYPDTPIRAGDNLHWTGRDQNWNFMCAECHSTGLAKAYDADTHSYRTHWAEIDVSCEACHGPGLAHARWAAQPDASRRAADPRKGLHVHYHERRDVSWLPAAQTGNAVRSPPRTTRIEIDACGRCHGRASRLHGDVVHGGSLLDSHRPALLDPDQYWPDGQMLGEVFNWGPFLQSRMYQAGVTCSDCHEPHSLKLRAQGNALCAQCHQPARYDQPDHSHHVTGSPGAQCVACHMPTTTFMGVDDRHDHAFRIPRPDQAARLGTPDACTACHDDRPAWWAADHLERWFPDSRHRRPGFAEAFHDANLGTPGAGESLAALAVDPARPAIVRATALRALAPGADAATVEAAAGSLSDADPLVRMAAVEALAGIEPQRRAGLLAARLADPVLAVRVEAVAALAGAPERFLDARQRESFHAALDEYLASLHFNADRPDTLVSLGDLHQRRGHVLEAERAYRRAMERDPRFATAYLHLADAARARGAEGDASAALEAGLAQLPDAADLLHALGLSRVRQQRTAEAEALLRRAAELAPQTSRYTYVLAIALHDQGKPAEAREQLRLGLSRHPNDPDLLRALAMYELQAGDRASARAAAQRLLALDRGDADARQLLDWIDRD